MKNILKILILICLPFISGIRAQAQVGIGTTTPTSSSILDLVSTSKGLLAPRMTLSQKNAVTSPATGLWIYQTDGMSGFWYYTGTEWVPLLPWRINGNAGTVAGTNFIGTTDSVDFVTKTNGTERMRVTAAGKVGIGTNAPGQLLETTNGHVLINNNDNTAGELRFAEPSSSGSNFTSFKARAQSADITYALPTAQGGVSTALINDGSGNLSWGLASSDFKQKAADESVTNSTTLQDDNDFTFTVQPNRTYLITGLFNVQTENSTGIKAKFVAPAASSEYMFSFVNGAGMDIVTYITSPTTEYTLTTGALNAGEDVIVLNGTLITGGSGGSFKMQWAQHGADVDPTTIKEGSYMTIQVVK